MKSFEIESWALRVLQRIKTGARIEDSLVELKAGWPADPQRVARRIAGHANAALGEPILWLIGADEKAGIVGADHQELSTWFPQVTRMFEGVFPALFDLNIMLDQKNLVALCFDTSRLPHVVKNPDHGTISGVPEYEVPWREGTRTRSATRHELIMMVSPAVKVPKTEILGGEIRFTGLTDNPPGTVLRFNLQVYVIPRTDIPITFPFHKCEARLSSAGTLISDRFDIKMDTPSGKLSREKNKWRVASNHVIDTTPHFDIKAGSETVEATSDEVIFRGAGKIEIDGSYGIMAFDNLPELELTVTLIEAVTDAKVVLPCKFSKRQTTDKGLAWSLNK
jgi:hypothetical protein